MKSLIKKYLQENLILMFYVTIFFVPLITILISIADYKRFFEVFMYVCLMALSVCLFWLIVLFIKILFFIFIINYQEKKLQVKFDDELVTGVIPFHEVDGYKLFMSKDWIISVGNFALHYVFIKKIRYKCEKYQRGNRYLAVITTNKGLKFKANILNTKNYKFINKWIKEKV